MRLEATADSRVEQVEAIILRQLSGHVGASRFHVGVRCATACYAERARHATTEVCGFPIPANEVEWRRVRSNPHEHFSFHPQEGEIR